MRIFSWKPILSKIFIGSNLFLSTVLLKASPSQEATPWAHNFLEIRPSASVEMLSAKYLRNKHKLPTRRYLACLGLTGSPYPNWDVDVAVSGASTPTSKFDIRLERQLSSDLERSPLALSVVAHVTSCTHMRAKTPIFFEMARQAAEVGAGVGRHLIIKSHSYTQAFGYILAGIGSRNAKWSSVELGVQQAVYNHLFRCSFTHLMTFGHAGTFAGIATKSSHSDSISFGYCYRTALGTEWRLSYAFRKVHKISLRNSSCIQFSLSIPLSF